MIKVVRGDITTIAVDAIVNAANSSLMGGGGVDGAIHRVGGPGILQECIAIRNTQGGCNAGEAVITTAGLLPAKYVIHAVGPFWRDNSGAREDALLASVYSNCLKLAVENNVRRISFPNISTGVYRFPKERAAKIAFSTVSAFLEEHMNISEVIFVCFDHENHLLYQQLQKGS